MFRRVFVLISAAAIIGCGNVYAQESSPGPGVVEATVIPAGAAFVSSKNGAPSFGNYGFGTALTYNINRVVGIEGEFGAMIATTSDLQFGTLDSHTKAPNMLNYNVSGIVTAASLGSARIYGASWSRGRATARPLFLDKIPATLTNSMPA